MPGLANYGAVLALVAPRPFFVAARSEDRIFPKDGIEETVATARRAYVAAGAADQLATIRVADTRSETRRTFAARSG